MNTSNSVHIASNNMTTNNITYHIIITKNIRIIITTTTTNRHPLPGHPHHHNDHHISPPSLCYNHHNNHCIHHCNQPPSQATALNQYIYQRFQYIHFTIKKTTLGRPANKIYIIFKNLLNANRVIIFQCIISFLH